MLQLVKQLKESDLLSNGWTSVKIEYDSRYKRNRYQKKTQNKYEYCEFSNSSKLKCYRSFETEDFDNTRFNLNPNQQYWLKSPIESFGNTGIYFDCTPLESIESAKQLLIESHIESSIKKLKVTHNVDEQILRSIIEIHLGIKQ